jgi:hypothetical protein
VRGPCFVLTELLTLELQDRGTIFVTPDPPDGARVRICAGLLKMS